MKKFFTIVFSRLVYTILFITIQVAAFLFVFHFFREQFALFYALCVLLSVISGLHVLNQNINPAYKLAWMIPIMLLPIFGGLLYVMYGKPRYSLKQSSRMVWIKTEYQQAMHRVEGAQEALEAEDAEAALHANYIRSAAGVPPYRGTAVTYFPIGEAYYAALKQELEKAERFIFLEYYIIEQGVMWDGILEILKRKAAQGLDVRVMYDDIGCIFRLPQQYDGTLRKMGIQACVFHRFNSILDSRFNTRDHRKICVIDGNVGFTGGINLADRYINVQSGLGHWKDSGVLLKGPAVWSLTVMFLSVWCFYQKKTDDASLYMPSPCETGSDAPKGYVQPFTDVPMDDETVGEGVYLNLINRAHRYVYITTPYLIIDNEMLTALCVAAKSGVDVRIMTPGKSDSKAVHAVTRSNYEPLLHAGVRIFEYVPGMIHAKNFVSDDRYAVVGTINLDYRSLYLYYECAAWMFGTEAVGQIREDFLKTLEKCREMTPDSLQEQNVVQRGWLAILRAFAPML